MRLLFVPALALVLAAGPAAASSQPASSPQKVLNRRIERNQTLGHALHVAGLPDAQVEALVSALQGVFDFRKSRVGDQFRVVLRDGELDFFDYRQGPVDEWQVRRDGDRLVATKREFEVETRVAVVELGIEDSLYGAAVAAGEDPLITLLLSDVFAWDIDFYRDVQKGDRARLIVEKVMSRGKLLRYGNVLAADYEGSSVGKKRVFRYSLPDGTTNFFQPDGMSARKAFLKSPLKYAHVTSRFGSRFHPILKYLKAHNGVDYGAPTGTPVWAVSDGTVTQAGYAGAGGNTVCVKHNNGFESCYLHLSGYGRGVRRGARISQKQIVGYVGTTGRSTGPHLHYALKRGGRFVNPLNQKFPRSEPLPRALQSDFLEKTAPLAARLDAVSVARVQDGVFATTTAN
ncbi:MAG: M23 family metallopeptidase [Myxococcaceae bacterium]|nr:M23 family metallopeptidase [Myxococcaceae bacterium]